MKPYALLCIGCLLSCLAFTQEFKFYLNGSNVEDSSFGSFQKGDLMRVMFHGKGTPYKFRIASILVTLTPRGDKATPTSGPVSFILDNTTEEFSNYPAFTFDLLERLTLLRNYDYDIAVKVNQLFADTPEGSNWIQDHVVFKQVVIQRRNSVMAQR